MENVIEFFIPKTHAQEADTVAQPTFGEITVGSDGGSTANATILLTADKTSVDVGENVVVSVRVNTAGVEISEYNLVIDFDISKFQVVDANSSVNGTQINFIDQVFELEDPASDNTVSSVGRIRLNASAPASQTLALDTVVAEITLQAQAQGSATTSVVEGVVGSQLITAGSTAIAYNANEVTTNIATETQTGGNGNTGGGGTDNGGTTGGGTTGGSGNGRVLPNTAFGDTLQGLLLLAAGLTSVIIGILLRTGKKEK